MESGADASYDYRAAGTACSSFAISGLSNHLMASLDRGAHHVAYFLGRAGFSLSVYPRM